MRLKLLSELSAIVANNSDRYKRPGCIKCSRINDAFVTTQLNYNALSVMACVHAPSGTLDITGSEPPDNNDSTVRS